MTTHFPGKSFVLHSKIDTSNLQDIALMNIITEKAVNLRAVFRDEVHN